MRQCAQCGGGVADEHRFCPWCAAPQRLKIVQFFAPHPPIAGDRGKMLRVSRYLGPESSEQHVRFSVWNEDGVAEAALSLGEEEANRLASFIAGRFGSRPSGQGRLRGIVAQLCAEISAERSRRSAPRSRAGSP